MTAPSVQMPYPMYTVEQRLSMLIHAQSKKGKSTLSATAPRPVLVLDAEGSWRFIPARIKSWDPNIEAPPVWDGTWDVCIVTVNQWNTVNLVYQWLTQTQIPMPFTSLVVDSITEIQRRCKKNLKGTEAMQIQDWGVLLAVMDDVIRGFRDLTLLATSSIRCVVFVAETRQNNDGRWVPYMQGQIATSLPYWVDICGYLYPDYEKDENNQPTREVRKLWIGPHGSIESGERVQGRLGYELTIYKPGDNEVGHDIEQWMNRIYRIEGTGTTTVTTVTETEEQHADV